MASSSKIQRSNGFTGTGMPIMDAVMGLRDFCAGKKTTTRSVSPFFPSNSEYPASRQKQKLLFQSANQPSKFRKTATQTLPKNVRENLNEPLNEDPIKEFDRKPSSSHQTKFIELDDAKIKSSYDTIFPGRGITAEFNHESGILLDEAWSFIQENGFNGFRSMYSVENKYYLSAGSGRISFNEGDMCKKKLNILNIKHFQWKNCNGKMVIFIVDHQNEFFFTSSDLESSATFINCIKKIINDNEIFMNLA